MSREDCVRLLCHLLQIEPEEFEDLRHHIFAKVIRHIGHDDLYLNGILITDEDDKKSIIKCLDNSLTFNWGLFKEYHKEEIKVS